MKMDIRPAVARKVAAALANATDPDLASLRRFLESRNEHRDMILTSGELEGVLEALDAWMVTAMERGAAQDVAAFRKVQAARPKLASLMALARKRENPERSED